MAVHYQSPHDKWVKCISSSGTIRAVAVTVTDTVQHMAERHKTSAIATKALAEAVTAGLILSSYSKAQEKINLNIRGSGWSHHAIIDANADAEVRGYLVERSAEEIKLAKNIGPWGIGLMSVIRTKHEEANPYIGTVPLLTGHLAKDLTFYWLQSEQVQSAVGIEVFQENDRVVLAEGFLIQALPGASEQDITFIEEHLKKLPEIKSDSVQRSTPVNLLSYLLENQSFTLLEEKPISFRCPCTFERVRRSIALVGREEIESMLAESKEFDVLCDFCSEKYTFTPKMLQEML